LAKLAPDHWQNLIDRAAGEDVSAPEYEQWAAGLLGTRGFALFGLAIDAEDVRLDWHINPAQST
jgi:hypothetical protein